MPRFQVKTPRNASPLQRLEPKSRTKSSPLKAPKFRQFDNEEGGLPDVVAGPAGKRTIAELIQTRTRELQCQVFNDGIAVHEPTRINRFVYKSGSRLVLSPRGHLPRASVNYCPGVDIAATND